MFRECYSSSGSVLFPKRDMLVFSTTLKYCWNDERLEYFLSHGLVFICVYVKTDIHSAVIFTSSPPRVYHSTVLYSHQQRRHWIINKN